MNGRAQNGGLPELWLTDGTDPRNRSGADTQSRFKQTHPSASDGAAFGAERKGPELHVIPLPVGLVAVHRGARPTGHVSDTQTSLGSAGCGDKA